MSGIIFDGPAEKHSDETLIGRDGIEPLIVVFYPAFLFFINRRAGSCATVIMGNQRTPNIDWTPCSVMQPSEHDHRRFHCGTKYGIAFRRSRPHRKRLQSARHTQGRFLTARPVRRLPFCPVLIRRHSPGLSVHCLAKTAVRRHQLTKVFRQKFSDLEWKRIPSRNSDACPHLFLTSASSAPPSRLASVA